VLDRPGSLTVLPTLEGEGAGGEGGGPCWLVESTGRHHRCSGWARAPSRREARLISDEDTPYMSFGCRNTTTGHWVEAGLFTGRARGAWDLFLFTGGPGASDSSTGSSSTSGTGASATEGAGTGDQGPSGRAWLELPIARPWGSTTYLTRRVAGPGPPHPGRAAALGLPAVEPGPARLPRGAAGPESGEPRERLASGERPLVGSLALWPGGQRAVEAAAHLPHGAAPRPWGAPGGEDTPRPALRGGLRGHPARPMTGKPGFVPDVPGRCRDTRTVSGEAEWPGRPAPVGRSRYAGNLYLESIKGAG